MGLFVNFAALTIVDVVTLNIGRILPLPWGAAVPSRAPGHWFFGAVPQDAPSIFVRCV